MKIAIIVVVAIVLAIVAFIFRRKAGYRGAVGFKNRYAGEIATIRLIGFPSPQIAAHWRKVSTPSIT